MIRMILSGSTKWTTDDQPWAIIASVLTNDPEAVFITGGAPGLDTIAYNLIRDDFKLPPERNLRFPANWKAFHQGAGPKRNTQMIVEGVANQCVCFHTSIRDSKGTADMLIQAYEAELATWLVDSLDEPALHHVHQPLVDELKLLKVARRLRYN